MDPDFSGPFASPLTPEDLYLHDLETCTSLLRSHDSELLWANVRSAAATGEMHAKVMSVLQEIKNPRTESERYEDAKMMRWTLLTYGGPRLWNSWVAATVKKLAGMIGQVPRGVEFFGTEKGLQDCLDYLTYTHTVLMELMLCCEIGGPLTAGESLVDRERIHARQTGEMNFTMENAEFLATTPKDLLEDVVKSMRVFENAFERGQWRYQSMFEQR